MLVLVVAAFMLLAHFTPLRAWLENAQEWKRYVQEFGWMSRVGVLMATALAVMLGVPRLALGGVAGVGAAPAAPGAAPGVAAGATVGGFAAVAGAAAVFAAVGPAVGASAVAQPASVPKAPNAMRVVSHRGVKAAR
jgi:hypothetical protein